MLDVRGLNLALGTRHLEHGTWNLEPGTWNLETREWTMDNGQPACQAKVCAKGAGGQLKIEN